MWCALECPKVGRWNPQILFETFLKPFQKIMVARFFFLKIAEIKTFQISTTICSTINKPSKELDKLLKHPQRQSTVSWPVHTGAVCHAVMVWRVLTAGSDVTHGIKCKFTHWRGQIRCCLIVCDQMRLVESDRATARSVKSKWNFTVFFQFNKNVIKLSETFVNFSSPTRIFHIERSRT